MKPAAFEYFSPDTVDDVIPLLQRFEDESKLLAGGQSLVPMMVLRLAQARALIDLNKLDGLRYIKEGDVLSLGAMTTHRAVERNQFVKQRCPMVTEAINLVGHVAIRNRGTVGGSIAHADPAAEWLTLALALDGEVEVLGGNGTRTVQIADLFLSYFTTTLEPDEMIIEVRLNMPPAGSGSAFLELARRHGDFGLAGVAAVITRDGGTVGRVRLCLMGVAGTPVRATEAEAILVGETVSDAALDEVADAVNRAIEPVGDIHASEELRRNIAVVLTKRALQKAWRRSEGGGTGA